MYRQISYFSLLFLCSIFVIWSCKKNDKDDTPTPTPTPAPVVSFSFAPLLPTTNDEVKFTADVQNATSFSWTSNPAGLSSTLQNPSFKFTTAGSYQITLTATNSSGFASSSRTIVVRNPTQPISADFTFLPASPIVNQPISLTSTIPSGATVEWSSNPAGVNSTQQNPSISFATAGTYQVILKVTLNGQSSTVNKNITVANSPVKADFTFSPASPKENEEVTFTSISTSAKTFVWSESSSGFNSTLASPKFKFSKSGTYNVTLTVKDEFGNSASTQKNIAVSTNIPTNITDTTGIVSGVLSVIRAKTNINMASAPFPIPLTQVNTTLASFPKPAGSTNLVDAGTVKMNNQTLKKLSTSNNYNLTSSIDALDIEGNIAWSVSGSADVPAFSFNTNKVVPPVPEPISLPTSLNKTTGFTIQLSNAITCDMIYVGIGGASSTSSNLTMYKHLPSGTTSITITPQDIANIDDTKGFAIVVGAQNYAIQSFGGKIFAFTNTGVYSYTYIK